MRHTGRCHHRRQTRRSAQRDDPLQDGGGGMTKPINARAWALCYRQGRRWKVRRVVWGRLLAREEKRAGEVIKRVEIVFVSVVGVQRPGQDDEGQGGGEGGGEQRPEIESVHR